MVTSVRDPLDATALWCPFDLEVSSIARLLNCELAEHPVYDGLELQWFDDPEHGTGMLAFLSRRDTRRVDYYLEPGLHLDPDDYAIGAGIGRWEPTRFEVARLEIRDDGVVAHVRFEDVDGRSIEVEVDDRGAGPRRVGELLAPVGDGVEAPTSLLLVYLHGFDLVRRANGTSATVRVDGAPVDIGRLPGAALHRRHLVKAAGPVTAARLCPVADRGLSPVDPTAPGPVVLGAGGRGVAGVRRDVDSVGAHVGAQLILDPPLPALGALPAGVPSGGRWTVAVDERELCGGTWSVVRHGTHVKMGLDVDRSWSPPAGQPPLLRVVTRVLPVFRRWPRTYRWRADLDLGTREGPTGPHGSTPAAWMTSRWERTGRQRGAAYRRATTRRTRRPGPRTE